MAGLRNSNIALKLFQALVVQPLLHNCALWIGIKEKHIKELQKFQNKFARRMGLTHSRIWIRYRARDIKGIKANHKRSWINYLDCRFCDDNILETQEHLRKFKV